MKNILQASACSAMALVLSACGMQPYRLPADAATADLNLAVNRNAWICANGEAQSLQPDASGHVAIPAGERVVIGSDYHASGYNVTYSCFPRVNFVPRAGESYYQDFQIEAERCVALIYRESDSNAAGLEFERSMRGGGDCKTVYPPEPIMAVPAMPRQRFTARPQPNVSAAPPVVAAPAASSDVSAPAPAPAAPQAPVVQAPETPAPSVAAPQPLSSAGPAASTPSLGAQTPTACGSDISAIAAPLRSSSDRQVLRVDCQIYTQPSSTSKVAALLTAGNVVKLSRNVANADGTWWYVESTGAVGWILIR